jgi:hypothetical protein
MDDLLPLLEASVEMSQLRNQLLEAKGRLKDIAMGAQMMIDCPFGWPESALGYAREVKRVASAPL